MSQRFAFTGGIGVGKSVANKFAFNFLKETTNKEVEIIKEYPSDYIKGQRDLIDYIAGDMSSYEFQKQILDYYNATQKVSKVLNHPDRVELLDRSAICVIPFTRALYKTGKITKEEHDLLITEAYRQIDEYKNMIVIFITQTKEKSLVNIAERDREGEDKYQVKYLSVLHEEFETYISEIQDKFPTIVINNSGTKEDLMNKIIQLMKVKV